MADPSHTEIFRNTPALLFRVMDLTSRGLGSIDKAYNTTVSDKNINEILFGNKWNLSVQRD